MIKWDDIICSLNENIHNTKMYHFRNGFNLNNELKWMASNNYIRRGDNDSIWGVKIYIII
jgi:hypothetical protein